MGKDKGGGGGAGIGGFEHMEKVKTCLKKGVPSKS